MRNARDAKTQVSDLRRQNGTVALREAEAPSDGDADAASSVAAAAATDAPPAQDPSSASAPPAKDTARDAKRDRSTMEDEEALAKAHSDLVDTLYLRCPNDRCQTMLDPTPEACCAMQCLCCGKHFCFVCMRRYTSSKAVHEHALQEHGSVWPKVPIVKRGHLGVLTAGVLRVLDANVVAHGEAFAQRLLERAAPQLKLADLPTSREELDALAPAVGDGTGEASSASSSAAGGGASVSASAPRAGERKRKKKKRRLSASSSAAAPANASLVMAAKHQAWQAVRQLLASYTGGESEEEREKAVTKEKLCEEQEGWTVLDMASRNNEISVVRSIVAHARARGCLTELLEHTVPGVRRTPVFLAVESNNREIVEMLLEAGADCCTNDHHKQTPLMAAAMRGYAKVGMRLLQHAARESSAKLRTMLTARQHEGWNPLSIASWKGRSRVVEDIIKAFERLCRDEALANEGVVDESFNAVLKAHVHEFVDDRDVIDNPSGGMNRTALHLAAEAGHAKVVRALLYHGANASTLDSGNRSALLVASSLGHEDVAWQLTFGLEATARLPGEVDEVRKKTLSAVQKDGWTPLHAAAFSNHHRVVRLLLDFGKRKLEPAAFIDFVNAEHCGSSQRRRTSLQMAAAKAHRETIDVFAVSSATNFTATDSDAKDALDLARQELVRVQQKSKKKPKLKVRLLGEPSQRRFCLCTFDVPHIEHLFHAAAKPTIALAVQPYDLEASVDEPASLMM